ncbi:MAG: hypothetical protein P4L36_01245 [Holophaga sp.]|nr:hypothetical protein [Holophaga sp.]
MSADTLTVLALRLAGGFCLVVALTRGAVAGLLLTVWDPSFGWLLRVLAWTALGMALLALLLFLGAKPLAKLLAPREAGASAALDGRTLLALGFALLGGFHVCQGGITLVGEVTGTFHSLRGVLELLAEQPPRFAVPALHVAVGVALVLGAKRLARWWFSLRLGDGAA